MEQFDFNDAIQVLVNFQGVCINIATIYFWKYYNTKIKLVHGEIKIFQC